MVATIDIYTEKSLTGRARVRMGFRRRLVLQVEVTVTVIRCFAKVGERTRWRDATPEDAFGRTLTLVPYE